MPKIRTSRTAPSAFSVTKSGKVKFKLRIRRHMFSSKNPAEKARLRKNPDSRQSDAAKVRALMPYA